MVFPLLNYFLIDSKETKDSELKEVVVSPTPDTSKIHFENASPADTSHIHFEGEPSQGEKGISVNKIHQHCDKVSLTPTR